jgi:hypothetical protein
MKERALKRDDFTDFFINKSQFQFYGCVIGKK